MLKDDIKKVKEQGKLFDRLSSDYDIGIQTTTHFELCFIFELFLALQKNADASKTKRKSIK